MPANSAPTRVPQRALETVKPRAAGDRPNSSRRSPVTPAITAVSNPNIRPANAAETTLPSRTPDFMRLSLASQCDELPGGGYLRTVTLTDVGTVFQPLSTTFMRP